MAKIYADLINKGLKTLDSVPESLREKVFELINERTETDETIY